MNFSNILPEILLPTRVRPDEIPADITPVVDGEMADVILQASTAGEKSSLVHGENMYVTLVDGRYFTGRVEKYGVELFTVGNSEKLPTKLVEFARVV